MLIQGKAHKFGANVDTDVIIPARYLNVSEASELARHCMEDIDPEFLNKVSEGDIIVATTNFGCGSSREHAPIAIKAAGISCVIAESFARIFFRNAVNIGLPLLESRTAAMAIEDGDLLEVDLSQGSIRDVTKSETFIASTYPEFMLQIIRAGGLVEHTRERLRSASHGE